MFFVFSLLLFIISKLRIDAYQLKWSPSYFIQGVISVPYAEIKEPFTAWYDSTNGASRIDYYAGMVKTYQLKKQFLYGSNYRIAPVTDEHNLNIDKCLQINGTKNNPVNIQSVLPDLSGYKFIGRQIMNSMDTEKWQMFLPMDNGNKNNTYTMYLAYNNENKAITENKNPIPVRFEMLGYNIILGSHYDHYYIDYISYYTDPIDAVVFNVTEGLPCEPYPGPGTQTQFHVNPMKQFIDNKKSHNLLKKFFQLFKLVHKKKYKHKEEHEKRYSEFLHNYRFIESKNRAGLGFLLKLNHLADWSKEESKRLRGRQYTKGYNGGLQFQYSKKEIETLNDTFDWRLLGAVTPVKDQSFCGSCWSFGTVGEIEGAYFIKYKKLIRFSEQALIDCSWGFGNNGCNGGEDFRSYQWIIKHGGLPTNEQYGNYLGEDSYCHVENMTLIGAIDKYYNVTPNDPNALRLALVKNGPISLSIDASPKTFQFYSHGVYYNPECKNKEDQLDHAVLLVGYGFVNNEMYWLVKNSWSTYWGNDGYILMSAKDNNCGVMTAPTFVTLK